MQNTLLKDKKILIMGIANEKSLAWGIARAASQAGAELILTYPNPAIEKRLRPLAASLGCSSLYECDVASDESIAALTTQLAKDHSKINGFVHAIAFADKTELTGGLTGTSRAGFLTAMDVSCYSFIALMKSLKPLFAPQASALTLTYLGAEKVVPNYNVMGLAKAALEASVRYLADEFGPAGTRVNAISAGPVNTLAARGIGGFTGMLKHHEATAPLRRLTTPEDVGGAGLFLLSPLAQGLTGEIMYVDGGANILGPTPPPEAPQG